MCEGKPVPRTVHDADARIHFSWFRNDGDNNNNERKEEKSKTINTQNRFVSKCFSKFYSRNQKFASQQFVFYFVLWFVTINYELEIAWRWRIWFIYLISLDFDTRLNAI